MKKNGSDEFYKVKIIPLVFFTGDTSGNQSKQYNLYDSWSFILAALPYKIREKRSHIFLVGAVSGSKGVTATSLSSILKRDLKKLERGVLMYSKEYKEIIRVYAPVLFITADNARHADIVGLARLSSNLPCRKCYFGKPNSSAPDRGVILDKYSDRTREHYVLASKDKLINLGQVNFQPSQLKYKHTGMESFLDLESFDPGCDTPTELLHCIPLGVAKILMIHLARKVLKKDENSKRLLKAKLVEYRSVKGYSSKFGRKLEHVGSLIGRDFKFLIQVLPIILNEFNGVQEVAIKAMAKPIMKLGVLSSLVFIREINSNLENYLSAVDKAVEELVDALVDYDKSDSTTFSSAPKVHALTHLRKDILRFGCALNYETERGEQFNKYIRQYLHYTNLQNTSRDLGFKFGRYYMINHMLDGGSWVENQTRNYVGNKIVEFLETNLKFREVFLGDKNIFTDNNASNKKISDGLCAVFSTNNADDNQVYFIGKVVIRNSNHRIIQYNFVENNSDGHVLTRETDTNYDVENLIVECVLDMHRPASNNQMVINVCKFGTYWFLLNTPIRQSDGSSKLLSSID